MLNIGVIQMQSEPLNIDKNLSRAEHYISKCVEDGAQLVVLPEMFNVGFYLGESLMMIAETLDGRTLTWLKRQASSHGIFITASIYEIYEGQFYNTMVMVGDDGSVQYYRKRNPTWSESAVWCRSDAPGPGIFDTPYGRIGGVICFDSFSRETYEGFKQSGVELVVIVALWGAPRSIFWRPDLSIARAGLKLWSQMASEVVPYQYARSLSVPVVFANQSGTIRMTSPVPFPDWPVKNPIYDFIGQSHIRNTSGDVIAKANNAEVDSWFVAPVIIQESGARPEIKRADIPPGYLREDYYFVQPPLLCKLFQVWFLWGLASEYEARRIRHIFTSSEDLP